MDFKKTVRAELDEKYIHMLGSTTPLPYKTKPQINEQQRYKENKRNYNTRLESERSNFNDACNVIRENKNRRLHREKDRQDKRDNRKIKRRLTFRTIIFFLPEVIAILVGLDVFNEKHGHIAKINELGIPMGFIITAFVIYCVFSLLFSIIATVKMFSAENGYDIVIHNDAFYRDMKKNGRKYGFIAFVFAFISIFIVSLNVMTLIPNLSRSKLSFSGGDTYFYEYVDKGEDINLPTDYKKADTSTDDYISKYILVGWDINGTRYLPGESYTPNGWEEVVAVFEEQKYCHLTVSARGYTVITISYDGKTDSISVNSDKYDKYVLLGTTITVSSSHKGDGERYTRVNGVDIDSPYTFELVKHTDIYGTSSDSSCLVEGTLITLANGEKKLVEDLQPGDVLMAFNHETGEFVAAPLLVNVHAKTEADYHNVINLCFSDGSNLKIVDEHGLFDKNLNKYVYINAKNAQEYVGHKFVSTTYCDGVVATKIVTLDYVEIKNERVKIYNPATVWHINLIANDMLTLSAGMVNLFEYDDTMKYDEEKMNEDIAKYGLYTYEDFKDLVTVEVYNAFPFKYYKVAISKGDFLYSDLLRLIGFYNSADSVK